MEGQGGGEEGWGEDGDGDGDGDGKDDGRDVEGEKGIGRSREGRWESGRGRCAVTGRRVLGGTEGLRRVMV